MQAIENFLLVCSGVNKSILQRSPSERNKYVGIGATVFFTGIFAMLACQYALYTISQSYPVSIFFGALWGLMIFNLDRYIVSTMKKNGKFFQDFSMALPRIILAFLIAMVIAKPLELKIFDSEIQSEIVLMQQENIKAQEELVKSRFNSDIAIVKSDIETLKSEITSKTQTRDELASNALSEADGTGGSQKRNMGPIYAAKKQAADKIEEELLVLTAKNNDLLSVKNEELIRLENTQKEQLDILKQSPLNGFAARMEALNRLGQKSPSIFYASIFIILLFIAIETAPIFVKLIAHRGPYDYVLDKHEYKFKMNHLSQTTLLENAVNNKIEFETTTSKYRTKVAIDAEKEITRKALQDHLESIKDQPLIWKDLLRKGKLFQLD